MMKEAASRRGDGFFVVTGNASLTETAEFDCTPLMQWVCSQVKRVRLDFRQNPGAGRRVLVLGDQLLRQKSGKSRKAGRNAAAPCGGMGNRQRGTAFIPSLPFSLFPFP